MSGAPVAPRDPTLAAYVAAARRAPYLCAADEMELARRARDGDQGAADKLVTAHLRLVVKLAYRYRGYGMPMADLIGEGNVGLLQAVKRFDPDRGFRLATLAVYWVRASIQEHIMHNRSMVKMGTTAAQKKIFFNLRRLKGKMQAVEDGDFQPEQVANIAHALAVPEHDVVSMNRRLSAPDHSLNATITIDDGDSVEWQEMLADPAQSVESELADFEQDANRRQTVRAALATLRPAEREILIARRLHGARLQDLVGPSRSVERVRQIEFEAAEKLRRSVERQLAERRRAMMARHSWAMPAVVLGKPDPERDAREIAASEAARPCRGRRVAEAA